MLSYEECHKVIEGVVYKLCSICEEWLPCTEEYYYICKGNKKDGLYPYCKQCNINKLKIWRQKNPEHYKSLNDRLNSSPSEKTKQAFRINGKRQREIGYLKQYQNNNKDKFSRYSQERRHKNHKITKEEWEFCKEYFNYQCAYCGLPIEEHYIKYRGELKKCDFHKEHVIYNGADDLSNCVPSCKNCNSQKWEYQLEDWYNKDNPNFTQERLEKILKWVNGDYEECIIKKVI